MTRHFAYFSMALSATLIATAATAQLGSPTSPRPSTENDSAAQSGETRASKSRPAKAEDIAANATIFDTKGIEIGYARAADAEGVVVATENGQVRVPLDSFGVTSKGIVIGTTKAKFDAMMAKANGG